MKTLKFKIIVLFSAIGILFSISPMINNTFTNWGTCAKYAGLIAILSIIIWACVKKIKKMETAS